MANYSVKQIAEMLDTNPETVRRWIRAGRLESSQASKKEGNVVSEDALKTFLERTPKYAAAAAGMAAAGILSPLPSVPIIGASLAVSVGMSVANALARPERRKAETASDAKENLIQLQIEKKQLLEQTRAVAQQLQEQLKKQEQQLREDKRRLQFLQCLVRELELDLDQSEGR
mgnify:CR=1 FL=1